MQNFDKFGVMIDCSRNGVCNVPSLKKFIGIISEMGYNFAMLYTEETYEVENEPYFGYMRGRFTEEELKEIDSFAASKGVELIPCVQTLAHVNCMLRWDEYRPIFDIDDIMLVDDDRTYQLIENIFKSLRKSFKTTKVHIGYDEAHNVGLGRYLDQHGYQNRYELLMRHLNRVCEIARKYGFEPMMWDDMFFRICNHGKYDPVDDFPVEIKNNVPDNCSLVYWDYYHEDYDYYMNMFRSTRKLSDKIWFAGGAWCWGAFTPHNKISNRRNDVAVKACKDAGIKNVILTMWGDNGQECPYWDVLPSLMHAAAVADGMSEQEMKAKFKEITGDEYDDFISLDLPNYIYGEDYLANTASYAKNRFYNDPFIGLLDLNAPDADETLLAKYRDRLYDCAKKSKDFAVLYNVQAALCDVLTVKFSLGARTRALYEKGDKEGLRQIALKDYKECIEKTKVFYEYFREQWYFSFKSFGFEVQDIRFGGVIQRLENCSRILVDYADGKIAHIEELETKQLPNDGPRSNVWGKLTTACVI